MMIWDQSCSTLYTSLQSRSTLCSVVGIVIPRSWGLHLVAEEEKFKKGQKDGQTHLGNIHSVDLEVRIPMRLLRR